MDVYQRAFWNLHYRPHVQPEEIRNDEDLFSYIKHSIRPLGRILEQAILRGPLNEATYLAAAQTELAMYLILFHQECVSVGVCIC